MNISGAIGQFIYRGAFTNFFAIDIGAILGLGGGDINPETSMFMFSYVPTMNIELQLFKTSNFCMILFGGGSLNIQRIGMYTSDTTMDMAMFMYGPQFGAQFSLKLGVITLTPFFMRQVFNGSMTMTMDGYSTSQEIPSFAMNTFGLDLVLVPLNITLSSMMQLKPSSESSVNVFMFSISYDVRWGIPEESVTQ